MGRRLADIRYRVIPVADPAVGEGVIFRPTGSFWWVIRSMVFTLVTDATVANRHAVITQSDGTTTYWRAAAGEVQAASLTRAYCAYPGADQSNLVGGQRAIPFDAYGQIVPPGHVIQTVVDAMQAGDQITSAALHVFEMETGWIAPAVPTVTLYIEEFDPTSTR